MGSSNETPPLDIILNNETPPLDIILFGDLATSFEDDLWQLLHHKNNAALQQFFSQCSIDLRADIAQLAVHEQEWMPRFTSLIELVGNLDGAVAAPALMSSLLCIYQVGRVLHSDVYTFNGDSVALGICTGSFAATAVAFSRSALELISAGVEAAMAAFRTGLHSLRVQRNIICDPSDASKSWSILLSRPKVKAEELLQSFCASAPYPRTSLPYLSVVAPNSTTISGPPHVLEHFLKSSAQKGRRIPIYTPYHAEHLHDTADVDSILSPVQNEELGERSQYMASASAATGEISKAESFYEGMRVAVEGALQLQVRWDLTCQLLLKTVSSMESQRICRIFPVASSTAPILQSSLQSEDSPNISVNDDMNKHLERPEDEIDANAFQNSKIAIVGFSGRYPDAANNEELWEMLMEKRNCRRPIPEDRFDRNAHFDAKGAKKNTSQVKHRCFIREPDLFDSRFFNLSARECENTDPAQRLVLMSAYEAMEMGGLLPDRTPSTQRDRIGVFFGVTSDDWREVNSGQDIDTYFIPGGNRAFVPGRISYFFRLSGPSISVDTACSSSFAAISTACNYLWQGNCDSAIAGGTNVLTNPDNFVGLDRGHFLSRDSNCNPFDDGANGYCRADAVGAVVLKRLEDALLDNDPIFGVIAGSSTNHCGSTVSITRPHEGDQLSLFRRILRNSNTDPLDVSYVEMHGTGTQAGDAAEMRSVLTAMAWDHQRSSADHPRPLHLGAVKANVGHSESASGVTALIKVLLMMQKGTIPPVRLDGVLNRGYPKDMAERNVHIPLEAAEWRGDDKVAGGKRIAFLNNFSAAGGNTAVLLQDAPVRAAIELTEGAAPDPRSHWPVAVSPKTHISIVDNITALVAQLQNAADTSLPALSYTTTARRQHYKLRVLVAGSTVADVVSALQRLAQHAPAPKHRAPPSAFCFTGQGVVHQGIAAQLFEHIGSYRHDILLFDRIARSHGFPSFLPYIQAGGDLQECVEPVTAHLALTCSQMALSNLWVRWSGPPCAVVGHSLGEFAALYAAGVLSASDTIWLVGSRAQLIRQHCTPSTHSMLAVKAPVKAFAQYVDKTCTVACVNSLTNTVVSGPVSAIKQLAKTLKSHKINVVVLDVPYAFHSPQIDPILTDFAALTKGVRFNPPTLPFISPLLSKVVTEGSVIDSTYSPRASRECVHFQAAIEAAVESGVVGKSTVWTEIGAHPACSTMLKQIIDTDVIAVPLLRRDGDNWKTITTAMCSLYQAGLDFDWEDYHRDFKVAHQVLPLPKYQWELKNYWIQYRNNFCLTKGDNPVPVTPLSSSVHRIVEAESTDDGYALIAESNLVEERLMPMVSGHKVNGAWLCSSSLYADMAFTISKHILASNDRFAESVGLYCTSMSVQGPFVVQPDAGPQLHRVEAKAHWSKQAINMQFFRADSNGRKLANLATCVITITQAQNWLEEWKRTAYLVTSRISALKQAAETGNAHKLKRGLVYKLFGSLMDYSPPYQGMQQVVLDTHALEATADVVFQVDSQSFETNPCWIDSLGQLAGFIMNGNETVARADKVFINHGWDRVRFAKPLEYGKSYVTYNRMQLESDTMYVGNTYVLDGEQIIAVVEGVQFQGTDRSVLDSLRSGNASKATSTKAAVPPQPSSNKNKDTAPKQKSAAAAPAAKDCKDTAPAKSPPNASVETSDKTSLVLKLICEEAHLGEDELDKTAEFADLGVDSLLALTITNRLQSELDMEIPSSAFLEHSTVASMVQFLTGEDPAEVKPSAQSSGQASTPPESSESSGDTELTDATSTFDSDGSSEYTPEEEQSKPQFPRDSAGSSVEMKPHATSVLLQGAPKTAEKRMFLFPDGAGSASSYLFLPNISKKLAVYGLNCPWLKTAADLKCSMEHYVAKFLIEVRRQQPHGPYIFGGASAGGILAYEAAQQLQTVGESVERLILIDTPDAVGLENPNERLYNFLESQAAFGVEGKIAPAWLRPHFDAFITVLDDYDVKPFEGDTPPSTHIIYARDGMCKNPEDPRPEIRPDDPREMLWLINNRTDFSGAGWNSLVGSENLHIDVLDNVNHYTILQPGEKIGELSRKISSAIFGST